MELESDSVFIIDGLDPPLASQSCLVKLVDGHPSLNSTSQEKRHETLQTPCRREPLVVEERDRVNRQ